MCAAVLLAWFCSTAGCDRDRSIQSGPVEKLTKHARIEKDDAGKVVRLSVFGPKDKSVDLSELSEFPNLPALTLQECGWLTDSDLKHVAKLANLDELVLIRVLVTDEGLAYLAPLQNLTELHLAHTKVNGDGLKYLTESKLSRLEIHGSSATNNGLSSLSELSGLQEVVIRCPSVQLPELHSVADLERLESLDVLLCENLDASFVQRLQPLAHLKQFHFNSSMVDDDLLREICALSLLEKLDLSNSSVSDSGLSLLQQLANLKRLNLSGCKNVTDEGLQQLAALSELEVLILSRAAVNGTGLAHLQGMDSLRQVILFPTQLSQSGRSAIADFETAMPNCEVIIETQ